MVEGNRRTDFRRGQGRGSSFVPVPSLRVGIPKGLYEDTSMSERCDRGTPTPPVAVACCRLGVRFGVELGVTHVDYFLKMLGLRLTFALAVALVGSLC